MVNVIFYDQADKPIYVYFTQHLLNIPGDATKQFVFISFQVFSHWTEEQMWRMPWVNHLKELHPEQAWVTAAEAEAIRAKAGEILREANIPFEGTIFSTTISMS